MTETQLTVLREWLVMATAASCSCNMKAPNVEYHDANCRYRILCDAMDLLDGISALSPSPIGEEKDKGTYIHACQHDEVLKHIGADGWAFWLEYAQHWVDVPIQLERINHFLLSRGPKELLINVVAYGPDLPQAGLCHPVKWSPFSPSPAPVGDIAGLVERTDFYIKVWSEIATDADPMPAMLKHIRKLRDVLSRMEEREKELCEGLREIARQKLADALSPQDYADADFEGAYDCCIRRARNLLAGKE